MILCNEVHELNILSPILTWFGPLIILTVVKLEQFEKQFVPIEMTEFGIVIETIPDPLNTLFAIFVTVYVWKFEVMVEGITSVVTELLKVESVAVLLEVLSV